MFSIGTTLRPIFSWGFSTSRSRGVTSGVPNWGRLSANTMAVLLTPFSTSTAPGSSMPVR